MIFRPATFGGFLSEQHAKIFAQPWPVIPSALVIAALNVFLFAFDRPWTASDGLRNWGDGLLKFMGVIDQPDLLPPLLYSGSLLNIGVLLGGLVAALLSREFGIRTAPPKELIKAIIGGLLMGCGAMLSFGCNIGGFFSALSALSASGLCMMVGLSFGAYLGTRYIIRERIKLLDKGQTGFLSPCEAPPRPAVDSTAFRTQPVIGTILLLAVIGAAYLYRKLGHVPLATFLFFGLAFGFVCQRSRFCLVNAFREPFLSGESLHARAAALALTLSMIGFSILKATDLKDAAEWVFPSFWFGSIVGGTLFGLGMVLGEGCGVGSIWRAGEGHIKLWVALFFFAIGASLTRLVLLGSDLIRHLGMPVFLPNLLGWASALWSIVLFMAIWYLLSAWNEQRRSAGVIKL
jgi:uncharacterized membrane protein YedE/YeeE